MNKRITNQSPLFEVGDKVHYYRLARSGIITGVINAGDREDIAAQGYRYSILIGQDEWSVPESALFLPKKRSVISKGNLTNKTRNALGSICFGSCVGG